ncbi:PREDICTED: F-box/LRR-repeat protein 2 [Tarenaya hassleriana]|uniref:F-box/LRR-repeat protein 2 n=1 Tax=Tarenaya hassleriana TaxID=28532 RepID=UPI00053C9DC2|nr:PREDICTED: F-box/LRR-repeat protein 2 [Tarenaya hassleriana]XP_010537906.1 PREDICTED: F-box/LRR-repeat protein 2 [Tarenaya hassleriana]XP_010537907.1 PREDICTED: F-box/LRR-repeat protein 2 [Tarenaya hassleriana]XP_010537908.1 PREDICTED: F-box/LRR-repeat protein 2 [Tarenaya hassleriana]
MELPEECWELICKSFDHHRYYESLSLVSTSFLSVTDRIRSSLTITDQTVPFLPRLLRRFRNLRRIRFRDFRGNIDSVLMQVSLSGLDLETVDLSGMESFPDLAKSVLKMLNLKELICSGAKGLGDGDLVAIGTCFPSLQELDISYLETRHGCPSSPVSDSGVISLSSKLKRLSKLNLSGIHFITDRSLISLSQNCVLLREVIVRDCDFITTDSISFVLHNSQNLESLVVTGIGLNPRETFSFAGELSELELSDSFISDELLCLMANANFPLKKLVLSNCYCFTFDGILLLLSKYQNLVHLDLEGSTFLSDEMIMELGMYIRGLTFVNLSFCSKLTGLVFFCIIENCLRLKCMKMEGTNFGVEEFSKELGIKSGMKSLQIARNNNLHDECLKRIARQCPYLELVNVAQCPGITGDGIVEVVKNCHELSSLDISRCSGIKSLTVNFDLPKLETLKACGTWIDDEVLHIISKRCRGLLYLDLEDCLNVTSRGVKEIVPSCLSLRELNLRHCEVSEKVFTWMVCASSSLRKIVPPSALFSTKSLRNFFLRHGCVICIDREESIFAPHIP